MSLRLAIFTKIYLKKKNLIKQTGVVNVPVSDIHREVCLNSPQCISVFILSTQLLRLKLNQCS